MTSEIESIEAMVSRQKHRVAHVTVGERDGWLKKSGDAHAPFRYWLLNRLTRGVGGGVLQSVPNPGGAAALATEAQRIDALRRLGVRVPEVMARREGWLWLSTLGETTLERAINRSQGDERTAFWQLGLAAIQDVHRKGGYLSQAFARNMILSGNVVGFIDFEEDPGAVMSLVKAQTRDWVLYMHTTAEALLGAQEAPVLLHRALAGDAEGVETCFAASVSGLRWLRKLPAHRRWGRDVQRVRAAGQFIERYLEVL